MRVCHSVVIRENLPLKDVVYGVAFWSPYLEKKELVYLLHNHGCFHISGSVSVLYPDLGTSRFRDFFLLFIVLLSFLLPFSAKRVLMPSVVCVCSRFVISVRIALHVLLSVLCVSLSVMRCDILYYDTAWVKKKKKKKKKEESDTTWAC